MRGRITIVIRKRTHSTNQKYSDKWVNGTIVDSIRLYNYGKGLLYAQSKHYSKAFIITRDELAFVKFLAMNYGDGDYSVLICSKGKVDGKRNTGYRRFWDGLISQGKFVRRKEVAINSIEESVFNRNSTSIYTESYISKYLKTKRPGIWHNL